MFNLIVTGSNGWGASRGTMGVDRTLDYTAENLVTRFQPRGVLDLRAVTQLPTVFACENGWEGTQPAARVGTLTRVQLIGAEYRLEYLLDPDIPPIPNSELFSRAAKDLDINITASIPESSRNHWSIKDVDLFEVLLKRGHGQGPKPKVFALSEEPIDRNLVAVMMPFDAEYKAIYEALQVAIGEVGMTCSRADDIWENDLVFQDVAHLISRAAVVVCDLSGRNANVFYETGIAHTLGRDVILIARSNEKIPFNVAPIRRIRYSPKGKGLSKLGTELKRRLGTLKARN